MEISELQFDEFLVPTTFACWKVRFKTEVCTCSHFPTEAMQWSKEVEMVESVDDLKSSRPIKGTPGPVFELFDARVASALNKIIQNTRFKKKVSMEEMKAHKEDRKKLILTLRAITISQEVDLVAGDFNGSAWRCRIRDNLSTFDEAFADCALSTPPGHRRCGDPDPFQSTGQTSAAFSNYRALIDFGR